MSEVGHCIQRWLLVPAPTVIISPCRYCQPACYHMAVAPALVTLGDNVVEVRGHWVWLALSLGQGAELSTTFGWHRVHSRVWLGATYFLYAPQGRLRDTPIFRCRFGP